MAGTSSVSHHLLYQKAAEAEPRLEPKHSDMLCKHLKWHFNHYIKHPPLILKFKCKNTGNTISKVIFEINNKAEEITSAKL